MAKRTEFAKARKEVNKRATPLISHDGIVRYLQHT
jgi:hypothetical protein